jgi:Family of unknown function (DUF6310)
MRLNACISLLLLLSACATPAPSPKEPEARSPRLANLQRAAVLPWKDEGRCVIHEASQPWPVVVERCFHALDTRRVRFSDAERRCPVASADAASVETMVGICLLAQPEVVAGAVVIIGIVVVAAAIKEELDTYELRRGRSEVTPTTQTQPVSLEPLAKRKPKPEPSGQNWPPPVPPDPLGRERRPECEAIPVPHRGGNNAHNKCADRFPPNRYPGMDVLVDGKHFDALQVGVRVLWEIKTDQFDTYSFFLRNQVVTDQVEEMREERNIATACGYGFEIGVSSAAHKQALLDLESSLNIVVTGCK